MSEESEDVIVHSFPKSEDEEVRIGLQKYKGRYYIDLRVWFQDETGTFKPSKKGISVSVERFPELRKGLEKLLEGLSEGNLIPAETP